LTGVAVNVTGDPAQAGLADAVMETLTGSTGRTFMTTGEEPAGLLAAHGREEVTVQITVS